MNWLTSVIQDASSNTVLPPLFGIILYTDADPVWVKLLRDWDYWKALDDMSGPRWWIFATRARSGRTLILDNNRQLKRSIIPVWKEPKENLDLLELFNIGTSRDLPVLGIFVLGTDSEINQIGLPLSGDTVESAYVDLRSHILVITDALERIPETDRTSPAAVLLYVERALGQVSRRTSLQKSYGFLKEVRDWLPFM
jgi:hypothetical protein